MGSYVSPGLWLVAGVLAAAGWFYSASLRVLERRNAEQRQGMRQTFDSRLHIVVTGAIGLLCLLATVRSVWVGRGVWWMWLLATMAQVIALLARERAASRFFAYVGERRGPRNGQESVRQRHVLVYAGVAALAFVASEAVIPDGSEPDGQASLLPILGVILLLVAALAALAAGWSSVWVFRDRGDHGRSASRRRR